MILVWFYDYHLYHSGHHRKNCTIRRVVSCLERSLTMQTKEVFSTAFRALIHHIWYDEGISKRGSDEGTCVLRCVLNTVIQISVRTKLYCSQQGRTLERTLTYPFSRRFKWRKWELTKRHRYATCTAISLCGSLYYKSTIYLLKRKYTNAS